ncbi:MAG: UPF0271 protein [Flavobacteriaceae bacterium]|jgi:UPF0271 protein|tara:strand:- start:5423 stop:5938 length:516 start_codon:yes stop_codon:yes gene_type:complete
MDRGFHINADVGEGFGIEAEIIPLIDSCNIACGGHAGTEEEIINTSILAQKHSVKIGAHPSYPDRMNFGRISLNIRPDELYESLKKQLKVLLNNIPSSLNHVKAHGALYLDTANRPEIATLFIQTILELCPYAIIVTLPNSILEKMAQKNGIKTWREAYIDRRYHDNGQLV